MPDEIKQYGVFNRREMIFLIASVNRMCGAIQREIFKFIDICMRLALIGVLQTDASQVCFYMTPKHFFTERFCQIIISAGL